VWRIAPAHTRDERFSGGLRGTFGAIASGLLAGLETLGVAAEASRSRVADRTRPHGPFCFDQIAGDEITVGGKKLIGSAQRRWPGHFIQQGSLILSHTRRAESANAPSSAALYDLLPPQTTLAEIQTALVNAMAETLSVRFEAGDLTGEEVVNQRRITGLPSRNTILNSPVDSATVPFASSLTTRK